MSLRKYNIPVLSRTATDSNLHFNHAKVLNIKTIVSVCKYEFKATLLIWIAASARRLIRDRWWFACNATGGNY